jgi:hypothetical protein
MVGLRAKVLGRLGRTTSPHPRACALSCPSLVVYRTGALGSRPYRWPRCCLTLPGARPSLCPAPYRAENPAEFWSGHGGEWASLVAGVRSVGSGGCRKIRPKRRRKPATTPLFRKNRQNNIAHEHNMLPAPIFFCVLPRPLRACASLETGTIVLTAAAIQLPRKWRSCERPLQKRP